MTTVVTDYIGNLSTAEDTINLRTLHEPLRMDSDDIILIVKSGIVQVFAVPLDNTAEHAHRWDHYTTQDRFPLIALNEGDIAIPFSDSAEIGLILVGIDDEATVVPVTLEAVKSAMATSSDVCERVAKKIEEWLENISATLKLHMPPSGVSIIIGETTNLQSGGFAWSATKTLWIPATPELVPFGIDCLQPDDSKIEHIDIHQDIEPPATKSNQQGHTGPPEDGAQEEPFQEELPQNIQSWLPVPTTSWIYNSGNAVQITPATGSEALSQLAGWLGITKMQDALASMISSAIAQRVQNVALRHEGIARHEATMIENTFSSLAAILDNKHKSIDSSDILDTLQNGFAMIANNLGIEFKPINLHIIDSALDPLEALARSSGIRTRQVKLDDRWWTRDYGPLMGKDKITGTYVPLLPVNTRRYDLIDPVSKTRTKVNAQIASTLEEYATLFYRPLPTRDLKGGDIIRWLVRPLKPDLARISVYAIIFGLLSLVTPLVTKYIFSSVVPGLQQSNLLWMASLMIVIAVSSFGFGMAQHFTVLRIESRSSTELQAAIWDRVLDLPLPFFRCYTAGDLTMRLLGIEQIRSLATTTVTTSMLAITVAIANLILAFFLQSRLALFGLIAVILIAVAMLAVIKYQIIGEKLVQSETRSLFSTAMELVGSVGKLQAACAESRGFYIWANRFGRMKRAFFNAQLGFITMTSITAAGTTFAIALIFLGAATVPIGVITGATFIAFNSAFTQVVSSITNMSSVVTFLSQAVPAYENLKPILSEPRENNSLRTNAGILRGEIDVSHVSFRYNPDTPLILNDITFHVEPGEMIALVGPSGAGKSSIIRILLGFEIPELGTVSFDGNNIDNLDMRSIRSQCGVVLQNATLMPGDIYTNIIGTRNLTMDDAMEAVRIAGLEEDIKQMPMGMHTFVAEGAGTISGGQRQRLLIARAVAGRPKILLFDEATSALDNRTQAQVSESIARLKATRIVIAHRLSTVRNADQIIMIVDGRIVQKGNFVELIDSPGPFRTLASRQLLA